MERKNALWERFEALFPYSRNNEKKNFFFTFVAYIEYFAILQAYKCTKRWAIRWQTIEKREILNFGVFVRSILQVVADKIYLSLYRNNIVSTLNNFIQRISIKTEVNLTPGTLEVRGSHQNTKLLSCASKSPLYDDVIVENPCFLFHQMADSASFSTVKARL